MLEVTGKAIGPFFLWSVLLLPFPAFSLRLVATTPQVTELLFQLGKGGDIIGTTLFSEYPAEAKRIPVIGPLASPGVERVVALHPDYVVMDPTYGIESFKRAITAQNIPHISWDIRSVEQLFSVSKKFLLEVYKESESAPLKEWSDRVGLLRRRYPRKKKAIIFVWHNPVILAGHLSFLSDALSLIGVENLVQFSEINFPSTSPEWLLLQRPEWVFLLGFGKELPLDFSQFVKFTWPKHTPRMLFLPGDTFARATFTTLKGLENLGQELEK